MMKIVNGETHGMFILDVEPKELSIVLILGPVKMEDLGKLGGIGGLGMLGDIQKESAIADVIEVILKRLVNGESAIGAQLPETGEARHDLQPLPLCGRVILHHKWHFGAWPDK